ncbi:MAG: hypothetical protein WCO23_00040 [bacterium]
MNQIKNAFAISWLNFKKNWKKLAIFSIIFIAISLAFMIIDEMLQNFDIYKNYLASLTSLIISTFLSLGSIRIALLFNDKKEVSFGHFFNNWKIFGKFMLASLIKSLIIILPIVILLIITASSNFQKDVAWTLGAITAGLSIFLAISFLFVDYLIVDKDLSIADAFKQSFLLTKKKTGIILMIMLLLVALNLIGLIAFIVGLVFTIPFSWLIIANIYRQFSKKVKATTPEIAE